MRSKNRVFFAHFSNQARVFVQIVQFRNVKSKLASLMICSFDAFLCFCRTLKKSLPSQSAERGEKNDEASPLSSAPLESKEEEKTTF